MIGALPARIAAAFILLCPVLTGAAPAEELVDLELVLAIDGSSSIDDGEFALEMQGYAAAFRDPAVREAIASGPTRTIAVTAIVWADASVPKMETPWFVLASAADINGFAAFLETLPRGAVGGTGIGAGVAAAIRRLDRNGIAAPRQVVDVSGDGRETPSREVVVLMPMARAMAAARGVTINGLAVENEDAGIAAWYRNNVMSGPDAFVVAASDFEDFVDAIRRKLLREIEWPERMS